MNIELAPAGTENGSGSDDSIQLHIHANTLQTWTFDELFRSTMDLRKQKQTPLVESHEVSSTEEHPASSSSETIVEFDDVPVIDFSEELPREWQDLTDSELSERATQYSKLRLSFVDSKEFHDADTDESNAMLRRVRLRKKFYRSRSGSFDLNNFLQSLGELPLFTPEQERHVFRQFNYVKYRARQYQLSLEKLSDTETLYRVDQCLQAIRDVQNTLTLGNLRMVLSLAKRYGRGDFEKFSSLFSAGNLALTRCINVFDYSMGLKFSTMTFRSIQRAMWKECRPTHEFTGIDESFLNNHQGRDDTDARDRMLDETDNQEAVDTLLQSLEPRDRFVIENRFGLDDSDPRTLKDIGDDLEISRERVRQLETQGLAQLARTAKDGDFTFEGQSVADDIVEKLERAARHLDEEGKRIPDPGSEWANVRTEAALIFGMGVDAPAPYTQEELLDMWNSKEARDAFLNQQPQFAHRYKKTLEHIRQFCGRMADVIEKTIVDPAAFGVTITWRETQREALQAFANALREGMLHLLYEIPTGVGKSMVIGAYLRAFLEVCLENETLDSVEAIILTSRTNLVDQLMRDSRMRQQASKRNGPRRALEQGRDFFDLFFRESQRKDEEEDDAWTSTHLDGEQMIQDVEKEQNPYPTEAPEEIADQREEDSSWDWYDLYENMTINHDDTNQFEDDGNEPNEIAEGGIRLGDVRMWAEPILRADQVRMIASFTDDDERNKNACLTIQTYHGLVTLPERQFETGRSVRLLIADEAHRLSKRVRETLETLYPAALRFGGSATMKGPPKSRPFAFFQSKHVNRKEDFEGRFAYYANLPLCVERDELALIRCLQQNIGVDLSTVARGSYGNMNEKELSKQMMTNVALLVEFVKNVFDTTFPLLELAHSRQPRDRQFIVSVKLVELARTLSERCNRVLGIAADWTHANDNLTKFNEKVDRFHEGRTQLFISAGKLGEGLDIPKIDGVLSLWPLSRQSEWILKQLLGRGTRSAEGKSDCLAIEPIYKRGEHDLASFPRLFGIQECYEGGIVVPGIRQIVENSMIALLNAGLSFEKLSNRLNSEEQSVAARCGWQLNATPASPVPNIALHKVDAPQIRHAKWHRIINEETHFQQIARREHITHVNLAIMSSEARATVGLRALMRRGITPRMMRWIEPQVFTNLIMPPFGDGLSLYNAIMETDKEHLTIAEIQSLVDYLYTFRGKREGNAD